VQVEPMKPMLKAPVTKQSKLYYDGLPSNFAFKFDLRRYAKDGTNYCYNGRAVQVDGSHNPFSQTVHVRSIARFQTSLLGLFRAFLGDFGRFSEILGAKIQSPQLFLENRL